MAQRAAKPISKVELITLLIVSASVFFCPLAANATSLPYRYLWELVWESDHIVIAKINKVQMVDENGDEVTDSEARTGTGIKNEIRLHVTLIKDGILKTSMDNFPKEMVIPSWKAWHSTLGTQKRLEGETRIFLLKGKELQPVYPGGFQRTVSQRAEIEKLLGIHRNLPKFLEY